MKIIRLLFACTCGLALALVLMVALGPPRSNKALAAPTATFRYVQGNVGADTGTWTSSQTPCKTIQYALAQANDGDSILVAKDIYPITYAGTVVITKSVTLEGGWGAIGSGGGLLAGAAGPARDPHDSADFPSDVRRRRAVLERRRHGPMPRRDPKAQGRCSRRGRRERRRDRDVHGSGIRSRRV